MNLTYQELMHLTDKGHNIYVIWKDVIYSHTKHGKGGGDYYTDPVLQVQSFSDTNKLPLKVTQRFAPIKKLKTDNADNGVHRWSYGAGYSESSDTSTLLQVFHSAGYPVVRTESVRNPFGNIYTVYFVANITK